MSSIIVGQPFDTVKVRLQTSSTFSSSFSVLRHAAKSEQGLVSSLFTGMTPPLVTATIVNAIVFSVYGWTSRVVDRFADGYRDEYYSSDPRAQELTYPYSLVPSSLAPALVNKEDKVRAVSRETTCNRAFANPLVLTPRLPLADTRFLEELFMRLVCRSDPVPRHLPDGAHKVPPPGANVPHLPAQAH